MAKVLIVGCGDVGSRLALRLVVAGHEVFALRRSAFSLPGVQVLQGDVTDPASLRFPTGLDAVFVLLAPGEPGEEAYRRVYFEGTQHVLAALAGQKLTRLFWVSSSSVYGQEDGSWVNEDSPAAAGSATGQILLQSEQLLQSLPWPATVLRFAGIYGPGRLRLPRWVQAGREVQVHPIAWTNRIHVEDCAGLLAFLFEQQRKGTNLASVYIGVDDEPAPQHEVLDWLAGRMGLPRVAHVSRPGAASNKRLSNGRISALGYQMQFPGFREGYAAVMGWQDEIR
ncbi:MAG: SDR family oxidoreductase [Pedobacter sp.]|nr:SDR family oxidoreductase [Pedobacter sp.]